MSITKIMLFCVLLLLVLSGCKKDDYACRVSGYKVTDNELCIAILESEAEHYEMGKSVGKDCGDEIIADIYEQAKEFYDEKYESDLKDGCMLIITEGNEPRQNDWYDEMNFQQFNSESIFPIRTWDLGKDHINAYGDEWNGTDNIWKYYIICDD